MPPLIATAAGEVLTLILLPIWLIVGGYFAAFAAHSLVIVLEQTAAGFDTVAWPQERLLDWVWKGFYLFGLVVIWLVPVGFLFAWIGPQRPVVWFATGAALWLWLVFPVSLLSSLSG